MSEVLGQPLSSLINNLLPAAAEFILNQIEFPALCPVAQVYWPVD